MAVWGETFGSFGRGGLDGKSMYLFGPVPVGFKDLWWGDISVASHISVKGLLLPAGSASSQQPSKRWLNRFRASVVASSKAQPLLTKPWLV